MAPGQAEVGVQSCAAEPRLPGAKQPAAAGAASPRRRRSDSLGFPPVASSGSPGSEAELLGVQHLRQPADLVQHVVRDRAVDLDQGDGVAARAVAAEMEGRDVDLGVAQVRPRAPIRPGRSWLRT